MKQTLFIKRAALLASLSGLIAFAAAPLHAADRVTPGQWETTVTQDGRTYTTTDCLTPEKAKIVNADEKTVRARTEKAGAGFCVLGTYEDSGTKVSYTLTCAKSVTTTRSTYSGDSWEGDRTNTKNGMAPTTTHFKAKRVGACK